MLSLQLPKFYDLVVKCLIKLTKSLQTSIEVCGGSAFCCTCIHLPSCYLLLCRVLSPVSVMTGCLTGLHVNFSVLLYVALQGVELRELLFSIHDFFMSLGVDEIRKRSSSDDKPLRMVKTILHELCKMKVGLHNQCSRSSMWMLGVV